MAIDTEIIDKLLKDYKSPEDVLGENGLLKQLTKAVLERAMQAELTHYLGYEPLAPEGKNTGNSRNGKSQKTLKGDFGELPIETPRDRNSTFEPQIVKKAASGGDLLCRGLTRLDLVGHRRGARGGYALAVAPARRSLPGHLLERFAGQDS